MRARSNWFGALLVHILSTTGLKATSSKCVCDCSSNAPVPQLLDFHGRKPKCCTQHIIIAIPTC